MSIIEHFPPSEHIFVYNFTEGSIPGIDGDVDSYYSINVIAEEAAKTETVFSAHQVVVMFKQVRYFYRHSNGIPSKVFDELYAIIRNSSMNDGEKRCYNSIADCWKIMYSTN